MFAILHTLGMLVADLFKSRCRLEAENLLLRHQLTIALRRAPPRFRLLGSDRPGVTERYTATTACPAVWQDHRYSHPGRSTSPIRPDMIFGKDRWRLNDIGLI